MGAGDTLDYAIIKCLTIVKDAVRNIDSQYLFLPRQEHCFRANTRSEALSRSYTSTVDVAQKQNMQEGLLGKWANARRRQRAIRSSFFLLPQAERRSRGHLPFKQVIASWKYYAPLSNTSPHSLQTVHTVFHTLFSPHKCKLKQEYILWSSRD